MLPEFPGATSREMDYPTTVIKGKSDGLFYDFQASAPLQGGVLHRGTALLATETADFHSTDSSKIIHVADSVLRKK